MKRLTLISSFALCSACWVAFAEDTAPNAMSNTATRQNATYLLQSPDFVATANGQTDIQYRCSSCARIHTGNVRQVEAVDATELAQGKEMVGRALSKYPISVMTANVDRVYILRHLKKNKGGAWEEEAGCPGLRSLYLAQRTETVDTFREAVFHHELCHLLLSAYKASFASEAWRKCNPDGFSYVKETPLCNDPSAGLQYLADGFVSSYGRTSFEEDVCTYAMWLFTRSDWMLEHASKYPRVQTKIDILVAFYGKIDSFFTIDQFRSQCQMQLAPRDRESLETLSKDISSNPSNFNAYCHRACFYNNLQLFEKAVADVNAALDINPNHGHGYFVRGYAHSRLGMPQEAIGDFNKALTNGWTHPCTSSELARAHYELGMAVDAARDHQMENGTTHNGLNRTGDPLRGSPSN